MVKKTTGIHININARLKVLDFLWVELFNGFVTGLDGFITVHKASFGRLIMTDLVSGSCVVLMYYVGRRRRTLGLERVERVLWLSRKFGAWLGGQITAHQENM